MPKQLAFVSSIRVGGSLLAIIFGVMGCMANQHAPYSKFKKIQIEKDLSRWISSISDAELNCRIPIELDNTLICVFQNRKHLGLALSRAGCFSEGALCGKKTGSIIGLNSRSHFRALQYANGYNLSSTDLVRFYNRLGNCKPPDHQCQVYEKRFLSEVLQSLKKDDPPIYILAFAQNSVWGWRSTLSHELRHQQYFADPIYKRVIDDFWHNSVAANDRIAIESKLSRMYDTSSNELTINEFQAFILQIDAQDSSLPLPDMAKKYRSKLLSALQKKGLKLPLSR